MLLHFDVDEIAVLRQFTDERIHLSERQLWPALQIPTDETVFIDMEFERSCTRVLDCIRAEPLRSGEHAENTADAGLSFMVVNLLAECADVDPGAGSSR